MYAQKIRFAHGFVHIQGNSKAYPSATRRTSGKTRDPASITDIVKYLKGITGRRLFEKYPEIRDQLWNGQLWNHSYYCETVGDVSESTIRTYIEKQTKSY